jgi:cytochrome P450
MFFLMENPHCYEKLQQEIDKLNIVPGTLATNIGMNIVSSDVLELIYLGFEQAPYINAVIHESLRLLPPAPENTQRTLGNNSFFVNGQYIPPGTNVSVLYNAILF